MTKMLKKYLIKFKKNKFDLTIFLLFSIKKIKQIFMKT